MYNRAPKRGALKIIHHKKVSFTSPTHLVLYKRERDIERENPLTHDAENLGQSSQVMYIFNTCG
jgi:hypothetical protein